MTKYLYFLFRYTNAQLAEDKEVVVLGSSFIAMEAANYCLNKVKKVTVIFRNELPFKESLGPRIGTAVMNLFTEKGTHFVINSGIVKINGDPSGKICSVELKDGKLISRFEYSNCPSCEKLNPCKNLFFKCIHLL